MKRIRSPRNFAELSASSPGRRVVSASILCVLLVVAALRGDEAGKSVTDDQVLKSPAVKAAREQAKLVHSIYAVTLDVMHERYFRSDRSTVPARAMEDVFEEMQRQRNIQSRWIGVNARTMSIPHEPKDAFERAAAQAIRDGKEDYESVEGGFYRRAQAIPLSAGCLTCHGTFGVESKTPRFAGLVMRLPLEGAEKKPQTE